MRVHIARQRAARPYFLVLHAPFPRQHPPQQLHAPQGGPRISSVRDQSQEFDPRLLVFAKWRIRHFPKIPLIAERAREVRAGSALSLASRMASSQAASFSLTIARKICRMATSVVELSSCSMAIRNSNAASHSSAFAMAGTRSSASFDDPFLIIEMKLGFALVRADILTIFGFADDQAKLRRDRASGFEIAAPPVPQCQDPRLSDPPFLEHPWNRLWSAMP